jgi:serine/threonine-protein kinase
VKLADFGIAKATEHSDMTKVGSVLGTAAYLSPEQARGEPAGPAADLYALGVVSYQLLAGRLPYEAASLTDLARQQDTVAPPPLHELDPAIPRALSLVVARALERQPGDRFPDAAAMEQALTGALRGIAPPEPTAATRVVDETEATRLLDGTAVTTPLARTQAAPPRRRRLEPIDEPPAPARRPSARAAAVQPARRKRAGGAWRAIRTLLILAVLAAVAVGAYMVVSESGQRGVQLKEQVEGDVNRAVDEIQQLIDENTR